MSSGHTFNPYDYELISRYLNKKITETDGLAAGSEINEVNICRHEPGEIPGLARIPSTHTWHVICRVEKLKGRCRKTKRSTKTGHWKVTGKPCVVKDVDGKTIGFKRYLVFEEKKQEIDSSSSSANQPKYTWTIHEFHSSIQHPNKDAFVLCKLTKKTRTPRKTAVADTSPPATDIPPIVTSEPITSQSHTQNDNPLSQGYDGDYCNGLDEIFPQLPIPNWVDQSQCLFDAAMQTQNDNLLAQFSHNFQARTGFDPSQCLFDATMQDLELDALWDMGND